MKTYKYLFIMVAFIVQYQNSSADETVGFSESDNPSNTVSEMIEFSSIFQAQNFNENGYGICYSRKDKGADKVDEKKEIFYPGELKVKTGKFFIGLGTAGFVTGLSCILYGKFAKKDKYYDGDKKAPDDSTVIRNVYMYTGRAIAWSSLGLLACGIVILNTGHNVVKRDETALNFKVDLFNQEYGAELSLSF